MAWLQRKYPLTTPNKTIAPVSCTILYTPGNHCGEHAIRSFVSYVKGSFEKQTKKRKTENLWRRNQGPGGIHFCSCDIFLLQSKTWAFGLRLGAFQWFLWNRSRSRLRVNGRAFRGWWWRLYFAYIFTDAKFCKDQATRRTAVLYVPVADAASLVGPTNRISDDGWPRRWQEPMGRIWSGKRVFPICRTLGEMSGS